MAKRIQMRKNRYQNLQKAADAKKAEAAAAAAAAAPPPPPPQVSDSKWLDCGERLHDSFWLFLAASYWCLLLEMYFYL